MLSIISIARIQAEMDEKSFENKNSIINNK